MQSYSYLASVLSQIKIGCFWKSWGTLISTMLTPCNLFCFLVAYKSLFSNSPLFALCLSVCTSKPQCSVLRSVLVGEVQWGVCTYWELQKELSSPSQPTCVDITGFSDVFQFTISFGCWWWWAISPQILFFSRFITDVQRCNSELLDLLVVMVQGFIDLCCNSQGSSPTTFIWDNERGRFLIWFLVLNLILNSNFFI